MCIYQTDFKPNKFIYIFQVYSSNFANFDFLDTCANLARKKNVFDLNSRNVHYFVIFNSREKFSIASARRRFVGSFESKLLGQMVHQVGFWKTKDNGSFSKALFLVWLLKASHAGQYARWVPASLRGQRFEKGIQEALVNKPKRYPHIVEHR